MSKKEVKLKGVMETSQVVTYLEDLVAGLKEGTICVRQGEEFVTLCPDQMVDVEVKATAKKGKEKFEMELSWYREPADEESQLITISSEEPEPPVGGDQSMPAVSAPAIEVQEGQAGASDSDGLVLGESDPDASKDDEEAQGTGR
ncbi:amphi-Trp domain-containing protein [Desulfonatronum thioautotrophicum]|uniref:amphi-Trp domain-containing protein n=1 Tax=Desulfonatronum thioautotrophicum TaxID=617001 RepID=UPI00069C1171|nr:amphi-Trp domain-containing protein [Desulfonatronum thioautotrophicum]